MKPLRIIAVSHQEHTVFLGRLLQHDRFSRIFPVTPEASSLNTAGSLPADALVIYTNTLDAHEADFLERLYLNRSRLCMLLICDHYDTELLTRAMRCGVSRILTVSEGKEKICECVIMETQRMGSRQDGAGASGYESQVLSTFGTKGGTGKTTMAVNLAVAMKKMGKKVALLDFDFQFGDVAIFMDIARPDSIAEIIGEKDFRYSTVKNYLYEHPSGVLVLCAPHAPEYADMIRPEHVEKLISALRPEFDRVIVDLPPALNDCSITALEQSDQICFVSMPDIPTLKNTKVCMNVLKSLSLDRKVELLLNKNGSSSISKREVESALECKPALVLPYDLKTAVTAVNRGIPFVQSSPSAKISRAIRAFAEKGGDR